MIVRLTDTACLQPGGRWLGEKPRKIRHAGGSEIEVHVSQEHWCDARPIAGRCVVTAKPPGSAVNAQALERFGAQTVAHLRAGFDRSRHPMLIIDDHRRWVNGNEAAEDLLGLSARELPWRTMDEFTPASGRKRLEEQWQAFLAKGAAEGWYELVVPDSGTITVEFSAVAHVLPARHLAVFIAPEAIDETPAGRPEHKPAWAAVGAHAEPPSQLTQREREVITLIAGGATGRDIAERLFVSPATVKSHAQNAITKLGARTRAHAVAIALVSGEIEWSMYDRSATESPSDA
jgi:PAS domain S-box-containing protein